MAEDVLEASRTGALTRDLSNFKGAPELEYEPSYHLLVANDVLEQVHSLMDKAVAKGVDVNVEDGEIVIPGVYVNGGEVNGEDQGLIEEIKSEWRKHCDKCSLLAAVEVLTGVKAE